MRGKVGFRKLTRGHNILIQATVVVQWVTRIELFLRNHHTVNSKDCASLHTVYYYTVICDVLTTVDRYSIDYASHCAKTLVLY